MYRLKVCVCLCMCQIHFHPVMLDHVGNGRKMASDQLLFITLYSVLNHLAKTN